jgi:hypothetical protein
MSSIFYQIFSHKNLIKLSLIIALLLPLLTMPYWYFQLLHIFGTIGFAYLAYLDYKHKIKITPQLFAVSAIIINPIIKIAFHRNTWEIVDIILAALVLLSILLEKRLKPGDIEK